VKKKNAGWRKRKPVRALLRKGNSEDLEEVGKKRQGTRKRSWQKELVSNKGTRNEL